MSSITVDKLSLNYPFYGRRSAAMRNGAEEAHDDSRLLRNDAHQVIGVRALQGVSFTAKDGDRIALVGHNGSGKTTLLQVLAGIYAPDDGVVALEGRATAIVNINLGMSEEATGHRNITLRGLATGQTLEEIEARREEIAAFSELGEFLDLPVQTYSAGMRMRLSFAIATAFNPDILILDEWLSAGDAAFQDKATERMTNFVDRAGILVLASHSPRLLQSVCNRALWLDNGRLRGDGPIDEILPAYTEDVARKRKGGQPDSHADHADPESAAIEELEDANATLDHAEKPERRLTPIGIEPDLDQPLAQAMRWSVRKLLRRE